MSEFNEDELVAPTWMNNEFFEKVLRESQKDNTIAVKSFKITPATKMGDHYASVMFRSIVHYKSKSCDKMEKSLIIKTMPFVEGNKKDLLDDTPIFETETKMYTEVIPTFEKVLREAGDDTVLGAKILYYSLDPHKLIVFEDLTKLGFETIATLGTSMRNAKLAILKLAKWHAISYKLNYEKAGYFNDFRLGLLTYSNFIKGSMVDEAAKTFLELLKTIPDLQKYVPNVEKMSNENDVDKLRTLAQTQEEGNLCKFFVLNHGDFHSKNMMFKRGADGEFNDVMLVDFQMSIWGPAALDVLYMLYMSVEPNVRLNHRNEIIYFYYENLIATLEKVQFKGPRPLLTDLHMDIIRCKDFELFLLMTFVPFVVATLTPEIGTFDPEQAMNSTDYRKNMYMNPLYVDVVRKEMPEFLHKGYLY